MTTHFLGPGKWPYDDGTDIPFGPDGQQRLATRINMLGGSGIGYAPDLATRDALVTNGDAFPGMHVYVLATDAVYKYVTGTTWTLIWTGTLVGARLLKSTAQATSGTINTNTALLFDLESYDPLSLHSTSSNTSRVTIPAGFGGFYEVTARVRFSTTVAKCTSQLAVNGTILGETSDVGFGNATGLVFTRTTDILQLNGGDFVEVMIQADTVTIGTVPANCTLAVAFLHG